MHHVFFLLTTTIATIFSCKHQTWHPFSNDHVAAVILARGGSKGIPLKNLAKISNYSLLKISLNAIAQVDFSSLWVSTDNDQILEEAGAINVHWRSKLSAADDAPSILGVLDFIKAHPEVDTIALIQCTSPFAKKHYLEEALWWMKEGAECVFSVSRSHNLRWLKTEEDTIQPLNFNIKNRPRRQDWNGEFVENGMFYFVKRELTKQGLLQSTRCKIVEIDKADSLEIDSQFDLDVAVAINKLSEL